MTDEMMSLRALVEKAPDADVLREMIGDSRNSTMSISSAEFFSRNDLAGGGLDEWRAS